MTSFAAPLPIDDVLGALRAALGQRTSAVLVAPPGAGKTTRAPLALLDEPWAKGKRLILLEPRRIAARAAAARMAATLGEKVGETIGLRVRLTSLVSKRTRIEVVTEGVFTRISSPIPRSKAWRPFCSTSFTSARSTPILALLWRSTRSMACARICGCLSCRRRSTARACAHFSVTAPLIESQGRAFPVATRYVGRNPSSRIEDEVARVTLEALA